MSDPPACPASSSGRAPRSCRTRREVDGCGSHVTRIWSGSSLGRAAPQPNDGGAEAARGESRRRADCPTSGQAPHAPGVCTEDMLARGRGIAARGARETAGAGCREGASAGCGQIKKNAAGRKFRAKKQIFLAISYNFVNKKAIQRYGGPSLSHWFLYYILCKCICKCLPHCFFTLILETKNITI